MGNNRINKIIDSIIFANFVFNSPVEVNMLKDWTVPARKCHYAGVGHGSVDGIGKEWSRKI
ncbi:MAG: hypothetical protein K2J15_02390 [Muribaculaceae bacterium]|nr:hypothetical protein [Muribaculaceae bacterium]